MGPAIAFRYHIGPTSTRLLTPSDKKQAVHTTIKKDSGGSKELGLEIKPPTNNRENPLVEDNLQYCITSTQ